MEKRGPARETRAAVVRFLAARGGEVRDPDGLLSGMLRRELGLGRSLAQTLQDMERDGMIEREVRGRRTYRVRLLNDWGLVPKLAPEPDGEAEDIDYDLLAAAVLATAMRAAKMGPDAEGILTNRLREAEAALKEALGKQDEWSYALGEKERELAAERERADALERNLNLVMAQLDARPVRSGPSFREHLSGEDRALLDRLMRELPTPRKGAN